MHWEGIASIWLALYTLSAVTVKGAIFAIPQEFRENYNDDLNGDSDTYLTARELEAAYELIAGNTWPNFPRSDEELLSPGTPKDTNFLRKMVVGDKLLSRVEFIWFPTTLWDMFYIAHRHQGSFRGMRRVEIYHEFVKFAVETFPHLSYQLITGGELSAKAFYPMMIELIEEILVGQEPLPHPQDKYFLSELYRLQLCNSADFEISRTYADRFPPRGFSGINLPGSRRYFDPPVIQALKQSFEPERRRLGLSPNESSMLINDRFMTLLFNGGRYKLSSTCQSLLAAALNAELHAWQQNKVVLFRFSDGKRLAPDFFPSRLRPEDSTGQRQRPVLMAEKWKENLAVVDFPLESGHVNVPRLQFSYSMLAGLDRHPSKCVFLRAYRSIAPAFSKSFIGRGSPITIADCAYALVLSKIWVHSEGYKFFHFPAVSLDGDSLSFPATKIFDPEILSNRHLNSLASSPRRRSAMEYVRLEDFTKSTSSFHLNSAAASEPLDSPISEDSPMVVYRNRPEMIASMKGDVPQIIRQLSDVARSISRSNSMASLASDADSADLPMTPRGPSMRRSTTRPKYATEIEEEINSFAFRLNEVLTEAMVPLSIHSAIIDLDRWISPPSSDYLTRNQFHALADEGEEELELAAIGRLRQLLDNQRLAGRFIWRTKTRPMRSGLTMSLRNSFETPSEQFKTLHPIRTKSYSNLQAEEARVASMVVEEADGLELVYDRPKTAKASKPNHAEGSMIGTVPRSQPIEIRYSTERFNSRGRRE